MYSMYACTVMSQLWYRAQVPVFATLSSFSALISFSCHVVGDLHGCVSCEENQAGILWMLFNWDVCDVFLMIWPELRSEEENDGRCHFPTACREHILSVWLVPDRGPLVETVAVSRRLLFSHFLNWSLEGSYPAAPAPRWGESICVNHLTSPTQETCLLLLWA